MLPKFVRLNKLNASARYIRSMLLSPWTGNFIRLPMEMFSYIKGGLRKSPKYCDAFPKSNCPGVENAAALNQSVDGLLVSSVCRYMTDRYVSFPPISASILLNE